MLTSLWIEGKLKWGTKEDGQYIVKDVTKVMSESPKTYPINQICKKIWKPKIIPKIALFLWLIVKNRLLTMNNLKRRGIIMVNRCILFYHEEEDVSHILIHYDFTKKILNRLWREGKIDVQKSQSVTKFIQAINSKLTNKEIEVTWITLIEHIQWKIWKQRNSIIFEGKFTKAMKIYQIGTNMAYENIFHT